MRLEFDEHHRYELIAESKISTGLGGLYKATDLRFERSLAVKEVHIEGRSDKEKKSNYEKAYSEVIALSKLQSPEIKTPKIYDCRYDVNHSIFYIMMDWIDGETLRNKFEKANAGTPLQEALFLGWMRSLCETLNTINKKKLTHKDIKPENIMITPYNNVYLIDFNISIETPNLLEGTAIYKAPEMDQGSRFAARDKADMFSVGVMLYEYYTGKPPIKSKDYGLSRSRQGQKYIDDWCFFVAPKEKNPKIPENINDVIVTCMKYNPKQRYRSYNDLKNNISLRGMKKYAGNKNSRNRNSI